MGSGALTAVCKNKKGEGQKIKIRQDFYKEQSLVFLLCAFITYTLLSQLCMEG